ncbi:MAG: TRAP transporter permease [Minwuia sp.]|uniref:TRAP transporter permease n=1 Tax=Minwuia sp. TaxID=2493630 RepID=UPI003A898C3A
MSDKKLDIKEEDVPDVDLQRTRSLNPFWQVVVTVIGTLAILLSIYQIFKLDSRLNEIWQYFGGDGKIGYTLLVNEYLYALVGMMLATVFIVFPTYASQRRDKVPLYDLIPAAVSLGVTFYLLFNSLQIQEEAWEYVAPEWAQWMAVVMWVLVIEAGRRTGGWPIFFIVLAISLYPIFADQVPQVIQGAPMGFLDTAAFHVYSIESLLGIPMRAFGLLVFGFLAFGMALVYTGAGLFFINFAFALLGHVRGGPAKVAIFSSGLFGSMSGGPITNVLTTGTLTIPTMRRIGFSAKYAGGIEACASTGGVLMPPIMGATAFVMADFLQVRYIDVAIAAIVPSLLYYFGLFVQIDSYAARNRIQGLPKEEMPRLLDVLKDGWFYIFAFAVLVFMLVFLLQEARAPFYATALLLILNQLSPKHRMDWKKFYKFLQATIFLLAELAGILAAIGLIVGAVVGTGMAGSVTNDLVYLAGNNIFILLAMGALTSFILGIGMTVTAAYIFLAIILAPALIRSGLDPMPVHMFMLYWGMLSFITPPVALAAFAAASVANAKPMETGFEAMRLGTIIYFIPFFFVFNPALLLLGDPVEITIVLVTAFSGVLLLASGLQGYLIFAGPVGRGTLGMVSRALMVAGGILLATPGGGMIGYSHLTLAIAAIVVAGPGVLLAIMTRREAPVRA